MKRKALRLPSLPAALAVLGLAGAASLAASAPAAAQSFNCRLASLPAEVAICQDSRLSGLDEEMSRRYARILNTAPGWVTRSIRNEQRDWLAGRNACGYDDRCIRRAYNDRIDDLDSWERRY
jgi:uncharacterized protein